MKNQAIALNCITFWVCNSYCALLVRVLLYCRLFLQEKVNLKLDLKEEARRENMQCWRRLQEWNTLLYLSTRWMTQQLNGQKSDTVNVKTNWSLTSKRSVSSTLQYIGSSLLRATSLGKLFLYGRFFFYNYGFLVGYFYCEKWCICFLPLLTNFLLHISESIKIHVGLYYFIHIMLYTWPHEFMTMFYSTYVYINWSTVYFFFLFLF